MSHSPFGQRREVVQIAKRIRAKLVLELLARDMSGREIRSTRHISQRCIKLVREAAERAGVTFDDVAGMPDQEIYDLLFCECQAVFPSWRTLWCKR